MEWGWGAGGRKPLHFIIAAVEHRSQCNQLRVSSSSLSHWSANDRVTGMTRTRRDPRISTLKTDALLRGYGGSCRERRDLHTSETTSVATREGGRRWCVRPRLQVDAELYRYLNAIGLTLTWHNTHLAQHSLGTTPTWHNTHLAQHPPGTILIWHNTHLAQHSFGTTLTWHNSFLAQYSLGTTLTWHNTHLAQDDTHMYPGRPGVFGFRQRVAGVRLFSDSRGCLGLDMATIGTQTGRVSRTLQRTCGQWTGSKKWGGK